MVNVKTYETTFIVNANLDDPVIDSIIEKVKDFIIKNGGEILETTKWGRKRFAYPIKKKNNGFYVVCVFKAPTSFIHKLERQFTLDESILRYLIIALDKKALTARISGAELMKGTPTTPLAPGETELPDDIPLDETETL
ncbi:MAG: 30S ribosomal protein S6 [Bacteroidetes bacterium]|nr:30S ribosomal protein S6 [Bacteroidota bacterium]